MKENIEEDITKIEKYIELVLNKGYCECNELNEIIGKHCDGSKNVACAIKNILSDYKRVLKENEKLKKMLDDLTKYIPKQKIQDKIEELYKEDKEWTEELSEPYSNFKNIDRNLKKIKNQVEVLQELLEEKK